MRRPTAAPHVWPYPHRSIAEIDAHEAAFAEAYALAKVSYRGRADHLDTAVGLSFDRGRNRHPSLERSNLPETGCPSCGARGWCGHHGRVAA